MDALYRCVWVLPGRRRAGPGGGAGCLAAAAGLARSTDAWVRIVGVLTGILAFYFLNSARVDDLTFIRATVVARIVFFIAVTTLVTAGLAASRFVAFGLIDLAGAAWTWLGLRSREPV